MFLEASNAKNEARIKTPEAEKNTISMPPSTIDITTKPTKAPKPTTAISRIVLNRLMINAPARLRILTHRIEMVWHKKLKEATMRKIAIPNGTVLAPGAKTIQIIIITRASKAISGKSANTLANSFFGQCLELRRCTAYLTQ